jgi:hypothetical protein
MAEIRFDLPIEEEHVAELTLIEGGAHNWPDLLFEFSTQQLYGGPLGTTPRARLLSVIRSIDYSVELFTPELASDIPDAFSLMADYDESKGIYDTTVTRSGQKRTLFDVCDFEDFASQRWLELQANNHPLVQVWQQVYLENEDRKLVNGAGELTRKPVLNEQALDELATGLMFAFYGDVMRQPGEIEKARYAKDDPKNVVL